MSKHLLIMIAVISLLLGNTYAAQSGPVAPSSPQTWVFSSDGDEGGESWLGVSIDDVTADRLSALKLKEEKGAEVTMVDQDAPAGKAGLQEHDVILSVNGTPVESAAQLRRMIRETPPGRVITLGLSRNGQPLSVKVQLASREKEFSMYGPNSKSFEVHVPEVHVPEIHIPEIDIPSITMVMATASVRSGLTVENITPQLGEFFGVRNGNGVLVRNVEKGSRAEKAGLRAGDVIVKVNGQFVHDTSDFTHAVHSRNGNSINMMVMRDRKEQNLNLVLPEHKDTGELWNEESLEKNPEFQAQSALALNQWNDQIAKLAPEFESAAREQADNARKMSEDFRRSFCKQQRQFREQAEKQREEFRKQQEKFREQLNRMRQQYRGHWTEI
jgi:serine protease Do